MARFTRSRVPGGTYFFSARLQDRGSNLLVREVGHLRAATRATMQRYPFRIDAIVILPAAVHTIWTLPEDDADYSVRWAMLKSLFSRGLPPATAQSDLHRKRREKGIWQRRFWEHLIRDDTDLATHTAFIHNAPVQDGLVAYPWLWPHSSYHRQTMAPPHRPAPLCARDGAAPQAQLTGLHLPLQSRSAAASR